ncbi:bile acid:sodium symporter family protein [Massilia sp. MP_M2]|uniref:bile acid:sodium symporter family protein n=1 Tax=Massilia sp. MP_M2 TaxID=3071713 RepID=UPI00319DAC48
MTLMLLAVVAAASIFPAQGDVAAVLKVVTMVMIGVLFFLHGAKLSRAAIIAGATHWRLHLLVLLCTFALFPVLALLFKPGILLLLTPELYLGILFLCLLPSTVQSSIAFTAAARGNVPAAVCSASVSSLLGIVLTPLLVNVAMPASSGAGASLDSVLMIVYQLLLPFVAGQIARRWIGGWVDRHKSLVRGVDQGSILLVVFSAFSAAVVEGLWSRVPPAMLVNLILVCIVLLAVVMLVVTWLARRFGFSKPDEITIVFCGSKKSLATGIPLAHVLIPAASISMVVLPLMLFHQIQLIVCAVIAGRYARRAVEPVEPVQTV